MGRDNGKKDFRGKGFIAEFKKFITRGNVLDMAVGVIVGGAFSAITTSLINDIIMPFIGIFVSEASFADLSLQIGGAVITYGNFIQAVINFLIIALCVFLIVKAFNKMKDGAVHLPGRRGEKTIEHAPVCPFCKEEVNVGATRCNHCAADLPTPADSGLERCAEILNEVGTYVRANGEALFGTKSAGVYPYELDFAEFTCKDHRLFVHVFAPVAHIDLYKCANHVKRVYLLETGEDIPFERTKSCEKDSVTIIPLPEHLRDRAYYCLGLELEERDLIFEEFEQ